MEDYTCEQLDRMRPVLIFTIISERLIYICSPSFFSPHAQLLYALCPYHWCRINPQYMSDVIFIQFRTEKFSQNGPP